MNKTNKDNTAPKKRTINREWEYKLADDLKKWAVQEDSFILEKFYLSRDIPKSTFYQAVERNPTLKEAYEFAQEWCGVHRETKCIKDSLNINSTIAFVLPHYFKRWEQQFEWRSKLNKEEDKSHQQKIVVIEKFPDDKPRNTDKTE
jgi:hypothetical protein